MGWKNWREFANCRMVAVELDLVDEVRDLVEVELRCCLSC